MRNPDFFRNTDQFCCICLLNRSVNVGLICLHKYLEMQVFPKIAHHKSFGMIYQPLTMTKLEWCTIVRKTIIRQGQITVPACNMFSNWNFLSSALKLILNAYSLVVSHNFWQLKRHPPQLQDHLYIYISIFKSNWIRLRLIKSFTFFKPDWIKVSLHKPDPAWSSLVKLGQAWWIEPDRLSLMDQAQ